MVAPTGHEYEAILAIVAEASTGTVDQPLPDHVLESIRGLVPAADTVAYFDGAPWDRSTKKVWVAGSYLPWRDDEKILLDELRPQLPTQARPLHFGRAVRITDFVSQREYRRTDLYQLLGRARGIEHGLEYWMDRGDGIIRGFSFDSSRREFSDRDVTVVEVLGRHLGTTLARFDNRQPRSRDVRLTSRQAELLAWVARGETNSSIARRLSISPHTVRKHLENAFTTLGVHTRAAAIAVAFQDREGETS